MINFKKELEEYTPIQLEFEGSEHEIPDNIKNSAILYNKALENLKTGSEDIAIIELKKAISMNPDFLKAMNLLGLSYCMMNDFTSASEVFKQVIEAEKNSVKALEYLNNLSIMNMDETKVVSLSRNLKTKTKPLKPAKSKKEKSTSKDIFSFNLTNYLLGAATGVILILFLAFIYFFFIDTGEVKDEGLVNNPLDAAISERIKQDLEKEYNEKIREKDSEIQRLQNDLEAAKQSTEYLKNVILLYEVENLFAMEEYEKAADRYLEIRELEFTGDELDTFDRIKNEEMNKAVWAIYNEGIDYFKKAQYSLALEKFIKVDTYVDEWESLDWLMYHMGVCYKEMNDSRRALEIFENIKEKFPKSGALQYVEYMINQITNQV